MEYLKLKENECLVELAKYLKVPVADLEKRILSSLEKIGVIEDDAVYAGRVMYDVITKKNLFPQGVAVLSVGRSDSRVQDLFGGLVLMAKLGDCESCGMETESFTERLFGTIYKVERCLDRNLCRWENREVYNG